MELFPHLTDCTITDAFRQQCLLTNIRGADGFFLARSLELFQYARHSSDGHLHQNDATLQVKCIEIQHNSVMCGDATNVVYQILLMRLHNIVKMNTL